MKITDNFDLKEFVANNHHYQIVPSVTDIQNIHIQVGDFLQPLRDEYGAIQVTSSIRSQGLNAAVGGAAGSSHLKAEATDFRFYHDEDSNILLNAYFYAMKYLPFNQLILYVKTKRKRMHMHYAMGNDKRCLISNNGVYYSIEEYFKRIW